VKNPVVAMTVIFLLCAITSGCASITGTTNQSVSVQTIDAAGNEVTGGDCELNNNKGKWFITSPGSTTISRSNDNLIVTCKKDKFEPGGASVVSATKGSMFGNILFGGGIGAIIDHSSGAAYEYPAFFQIQMGFNKLIDMTKPEGQQIVVQPREAKPGKPPAETVIDTGAKPVAPTAQK
jgi:hypothetical protein